MPQERTHDAGEASAEIMQLQEDLRIEREQCDRAVATLMEIVGCDETGHTGMTWAKHAAEQCIADMRSLEEPDSGTSWPWWLQGSRRRGHDEH